MRRFAFWLLLLVAVGGFALSACSSTIGGKEFSFAKSATDAGTALTNTGTSTGNPALVLVGQGLTLIGAIGAALIADKRQDNKPFVGANGEKVTEAEMVTAVRAIIAGQSAANLAAPKPVA